MQSISFRFHHNMSITRPSLRVNALILLLVVVQSNQECLDDFQYLCGAQQITIIKGTPLYLAAPGTRPTCDLNVAADCSAEINAIAGLKIQLIAVTALPMCGGDNYVEFSDGVSAPLRLCTGNSTNHTFANSILSVRFRSSTSSNVMSITLSAVGCPVEELITGPHITADVEQAANHNRYSAAVKCSSGYLINNQSTELSVACAQSPAVQTYSWENPGDKITCQAAQCLAPPTVQNATHNGTLSRYSYLSTVSYRCNPAYLLLGIRSKQCVTENNRGAIWSDGTTQCQPAVCLTPPSIRNGSFSPHRDSYPYASNVTYSCNQGYLLMGSTEITCTADSDIQATWTGLSASCQPAHCSTPPTVQYATNDGTLATYPYLSTVNYTCNPGYLISGNRTMQCSTQNNVAKWSNTSIQCQAAQCLSPPTVQNATHNGTLSRYSYLSTVSYRCNPGYLISGNRSKQCTTENNRAAIWTDGSTQCQSAVCLTPPSISNGSFSPQRNDYPYASNVTYSCNQGYLLMGSAEITCTADSDIQVMWTSLFASCQPAHCTTPPMVLYTTNDGTLTTYPYLSKVNYTCNPGYLISGNRTMQCSTQNNVAEWSNTAVQCRAAVCTDPPILSNGTYKPSQSSYRYPDVITYSCNEGFVLKGNNTSGCTTNSDIEAAWTLVSASCRQAECPNICPHQFFTNLTNIPDLPVAGDTVSYQCVADNTTITLTCLSDGVTGYWNGTLSACSPAESTGYTEVGLGVIIGASVGGVAAVVLVLYVILILRRRQMFGKNVERDSTESTAAIVDGRPESTGSGLYADVELVPATILPQNDTTGQTIEGKPKKSSPVHADRSQLYAAINTPKPAGSEPKRVPKQKEHSKSHDEVAPNDDSSQMYATVLKRSAATGSSKRPFVVDQEVELVDNELYAPTLMVPSKSVSLASQDIELIDNDLYST